MFHLEYTLNEPTKYPFGQYLTYTMIGSLYATLTCFENSGIHKQRAIMTISKIFLLCNTRWEIVVGRPFNRSFIPTNRSFIPIIHRPSKFFVLACTSPHQMVVEYYPAAYRAGGLQACGSCPSLIASSMYFGNKSLCSLKNRVKFESRTYVTA